MWPSSCADACTAWSPGQVMRFPNLLAPRCTRRRRTRCLHMYFLFMGPSNSGASTCFYFVTISRNTSSYTPPTIVPLTTPLTPFKSGSVFLVRWSSWSSTWSPTSRTNSSKGSQSAPASTTTSQRPTAPGRTDQSSVSAERYCAPVGRFYQSGSCSSETGRAFQKVFKAS